MNKEKLLKILESSVDILNEVFTKADDDFIEDRTNEVIMDLSYLINEIKK